MYLYHGKHNYFSNIDSIGEEMWKKAVNVVIKSVLEDNPSDEELALYLGLNHNYQVYKMYGL